MRTTSARWLSSLLALGLVLGAAAAVLRGLDSIGRWVFEASAGRSYATLPALERALRARLELPGYFPAELGWPPSRIESSGSNPAIAVLGITGQGGGQERLVIAQTVGRGDADLEALLPPGVQLDVQPLALGAYPARLARVQGTDGAQWYQLTWRQQERRLAMSSRGSLEQLLKMARTVRREGSR